MDQKGEAQTKAQQKLQKSYSYFFRAALIKGPQFYKYEAYKIPINSKKGQQNYEIVSKIGRGKYSDVFKAINVNTDKNAVLKILKPIREDKIKRQIKILNQLNHPNIVKLYEVLRDEPSKCYVLVFEYVNTADYRDLVDTVKQKDIRKVIYQVLQGLLHCHEKGIVHRDIKPQNLLISQETLNTKISDWGLAEYYLPKTEYNVRVASRHFKGPELLLNNRNYDFSLDIWSLGLVFAGFIFRRHALFRGNNNPNQLNEIMKHFGTKEIQAYIQKYKLEPDQQTKEYISSCTQRDQRPWSHYLDKDNKDLYDETALDLMDNMLQIDHSKRINVIEALKHKYFASIEHEA